MNPFKMFTCTYCPDEVVRNTLVLWFGFLSKPKHDWHSHRLQLPLILHIKQKLGTGDNCCDNLTPF